MPRRTNEHSLSLHCGTLKSAPLWDTEVSPPLQLAKRQKTLDAKFTTALVGSAVPQATRFRGQADSTAGPPHTLHRVGPSRNTHPHSPLTLQASLQLLASLDLAMEGEATLDLEASPPRGGGSPARSLYVIPPPPGF